MAHSKPLDLTDCRRLYTCCYACRTQTEDGLHMRTIAGRISHCAVQGMGPGHGWRTSLLGTEVWGDRMCSVSKKLCPAGQQGTGPSGLGCIRQRFLRRSRRDPLDVRTVLGKRDLDTA